MQRPIEPEVYTFADLASRFRLSRYIARGLIAEGKLKAQRFGKAQNSQIIVTAASVRAFLANGSPYPRFAQPRTGNPLVVPIPLSSLRSMTADEVAELRERQVRGELVERTIAGHACLVPVGSAK